MRTKKPEIPFIFSLRGKAILLATFFIVVFTALSGYIILSREKALYLKDRENQAKILVETAGINFTNAILYQEVGLIEETGVVDRYIAELLNKEKNILTIIIFDNNGTVTAHCHIFEHGKFYSNAKELISHTDTFIREVRDKERGPILEAVTPLTVGKKRIATLRLEFSLKDFYEKLADLGKRILLLTVLAIFSSIFFVVLGINAMTKPIIKLSKAMDNIEYGRYDTFPEALRKDEMGHLQASFMGMVRRLKEADINWENTFNSITDLLSIHGRDFRILKVNNALARRLHTAPEALVGRYCWEVYQNFNAACPDCPHAQTLKTGDPSTMEKEYTPLGGIFLSTTFPYFNEDGKIVGTIHIAKDITEERRLQKKLIRSEKMSAMGQMASGIAHEINNPLNSILGYSTYMLESWNVEDAHGEELRKIVNAAVRCKETVKKFLDLAREAPERIESVNINEVIEEALSLCSHSISSQNIKVTKNTDINLWVKADKRRMEEVFINIILNACQAMDNGGELTIKGCKDGDSIKVEITDTGCGIAQENLHRIFDPFYTTKEPGKGTGLGLAVSHTIIRNHGGAIDCESSIGKGTKFTIMLPRLTLQM